MKEETPRRDIEERTFRFAVRMVKMARAIPRTGANAVMINQVMRCGTSVGANVEEAHGAPSKKDVVRKMNVARAEARDAHDWLRLLSETGIVAANQLESLTDEADQLVRILTAIVKNAREQQ